MDKPANRSLLWAQTLVDELLRAGLGSVCIAPGSRSTPLALAFAAQRQAPVFVHPDERGAAFFALGQALASGKPAAILCTSGTAAANFFPAIVEAHLVNAPLLVLTADRPDELRDSGSNQTIDQVKLYGGFVRWSVDVAAPEAAPALTSLAALRALACRAIARTQGLPPGPVHLNLPLRKPLEPEAVPGDVPEALWSAQDGPALARPDGRPFVQMERGQVAPSGEQIAALAGLVGSAQRGLIFCGPRCPGGDFPAAVVELARRSGFPLLADGLSGLRFCAAADGGALLAGGYETYLHPGGLRSELAPDLILQFGALPVSAALTDSLAAWRSAARIQIDGAGGWSDDAFTTSQHLWADPALVCRALVERLPQADPAPAAGWQNAWRQAEAAAWEALDSARQEGFFEGLLLPEALGALQPGDALVVGNSLPVRHLDQFCAPQALGVRVYANRGASGIDGTLATAAGIAAAGVHRRVLLVLGDLSALHDLNSLLAVRNYAPNLVTLLINNDGGGIFQRLPVARYEPPFTGLFRLPHGLGFEQAARMFDLSYTCPDGPSEIRQALHTALAGGPAQIIEVTTSAVQHEAARRQVLQHFTTLWQAHSQPTPEKLYG